MKENRSLHLRVQEMCDCYATTDPLEEMAKMANEAGDPQESAVKWLALAILHAINSNAEEIALRRNEEGQVLVTAKYRTGELPPPSTQITQAVEAALRDITHIEEEKGRLPLSIGIRGSSIDLEVRVEKEERKSKLKLKFK